MSWQGEPSSVGYSQRSGDASPAFPSPLATYVGIWLTDVPPLPAKLSQDENRFAVLAPSELSVMLVIVILASSIARNPLRPLKIFYFVSLDACTGAPGSG
jgi:hypothetical protein